MKQLDKTTKVKKKHETPKTQVRVRLRLCCSFELVDDDTASVECPALLSLILSSLILLSLIIDPGERKALPLAEAVTKVTRVADEDILASLDKVAGGHVPAEGAGSSNNERLSRGEEDLTEKLNRLAEGRDEVGGYVGGGGGGHGLENVLVELDGTYTFSQ